MDLNNAYAFYYVSKYQNFSKAAEELYISQGGVSLRIKRLEEELGIELIKRSSRKMELTEAGKSLYQQLEHFMESIPNIVNSIKKIKENSGRRSIVIGMHHKFGEEFIKPFFAKFKSEFDHVRLHYDSRENLFRALKEEKVHFIVSTTPYRPNMELTIEKVGESNMVIVAKDDLEKLENYDLLHMQLMSFPKEKVDEIARTLPKKPRMIESIDGGLELYIDALVKGESALIIQEENLKKEINEGKLKVIKQLETLDVNVFYLPKNQDNSEIITTLDILAHKI